MKKKAWVLGGLGALLVGLLTVYLIPRPPRVEPSSGRRIDPMRAFESGDYALSLASARERLAAGEQSVALTMLAGEAATKLERFDEALRLYDGVPDAAGADAATARWASGEILFHLGRARDSLQMLDHSLKLNPRQYLAHDRSAYILTSLGRRREALPHLMALISSDRGTLDHLLEVGNLSKQFDDRAELARYQSLNPGDLLPNLGLAINHREQGEFEPAEKLLLALIEQQPNLVEAHVQLGFLWLAIDAKRLANWQSNLPASADANPNIWYLVGQHVLAQGQNACAIRCFAESLARDAEHLAAHASLAQQLQREGRTEDAGQFSARANRLQQLNLALEQIYQSRQYLPPIRQAAELTLELGRLWEAAGWSAYALGLDRNLQWPLAILQRTKGRLQRESPQTLPECNLISQAQWRSDYPLPVWRGMADFKDTSERASERFESLSSEVSFIEVAKEAQIDVIPIRAANAAHKGRRMYEVYGSGVGVIDYDQDGWADLFFAQTTTWPPSAQQLAPGDRLYRNLGPTNSAEVVFRDVTSDAGLVEAGFGQGVAVGDVNCDGFDDVYVCNIGQNQLWFNQGDGVFLDGNAAMQPESQPSWTVSAAIADLNFDGLPEIYDANYVTGDEVFTKLCNVGGRPRARSPLVFAPAKDIIWKISDDAIFRELNNRGGSTMTANSLGLVVHQATGSELPQILVAVDQQPNLLLKVVRDEQTGSGFKLEDEALLRGIALDAAGRSQACMGIAAGDVDQDGDVDFYITNFYQEYNTLYLQEDGSFRDATARFGLIAPTVPMLGFGTQFVDFELDGRPDLVVLNGHIDDHTHVGVAQHMRPQAFSQLPDGQFRELQGGGLGTFFERPALGRALAKLDFNRDGLPDLVGTDLEQPVFLLQNGSQASGSSVTVYFVGTKSDRNAVCTRATLLTDKFRQTQQLTAGSGYMVSNERCLTFSVPISAEKFSLEVYWPSGTRQQVENLLPNRAYTVIEGQGTVQRIKDLHE